MVHGEVSAECFRIFMLGDFRVELRERAIHFPTRKIESMLAYLILHPAEHTREKLATLFWGDFSEENAHGSLRNALAFLRKTLTNKIVFADREIIQISPAAALWVDALRFERQARLFLAEPLTEPSSIEMELYQGELLCDFYDEWILPLREHFRTYYVQALLCAVESLRARSEYQFAIKHAQQILKSDPTNERAYQHLMFCHVVQGDRLGALQVYRACRRVLQHELGVEPTRETQALYAWLKHLDFPAISARLTNLPIPISSFIGRVRELADIKQTLARVRLVTLTGAGGSGKTRLAIHAATDLIDAFKDGIWWVDLASLTDAALVPLAVSKSLGLSPQSGQPVVDTLSTFLHHKQILLVFDNCEHLLAACAKLTESLLNACTGLKILATSRESFGLSGEHIWQVPTLSLPSPKNITLAGLLMEYEGIRLFVERAQAVRPDFILTEENALLVAQICQHLDGIPLAIELAAARVKSISVEHIASHLDDRFRLLVAEHLTSHPRHQTLRATVDWSYSLLQEAERQLFYRLSVFSGGWTLEAAEYVCVDEDIASADVLPLLAHLVNKSLVIRFDEQRYGLLETMRQFAAEIIDQTGQRERLSRQHLDYYLKIAVTGDEKVRGPEQFTWIKLLDADHDNFAIALERALDSADALEKGCELVCALTWYWGVVGDFIQAKHWLEIALQSSVKLGKTATRARVLFNAGALSVWGLNMLKPAEALAAVEQSLDLWRLLGEEYIHETGKSLFTIGWIQYQFFGKNEGFDNFRNGVKILEATGQDWWQAWALNVYELMIWDYDLSRSALIKKEAALWEKLGDQIGLAQPTSGLGLQALERGDFVSADEYLLKNLQIFRASGAKGYMLQMLSHLGDAARGLKKYDQAEMNYQESISLVAETMLEAWLPNAYSGLGYVFLHRGDAFQAEIFFQKAQKLSRNLKMQGREILCIAGFAAVATARGKYIEAVRLFASCGAQIEALRGQQHSKKSQVQPADQLEIDEYLAQCRANLDDDVFTQAQQDGRALSMEQILEGVVPDVTPTVS